ncbi:MAG: F0F1 ATP synthase subunit epsilon [Nitrospirae bacterium]|nr:F0F1 ATP synthase subunit epsilon [Nitrospirota bacterium]
MAERLKLDIVSPDKLVLSDEVDEVVAPGSEGEFGVLPGHLALLATLDIGELTLRKSSGFEHVFVSSGYAEVLNDKVTILVESAENSRDIDVNRAQAAKSRAEDRLSRTHDGSIDVARAEVALKRALHRLEVARKVH